VSRFYGPLTKDCQFQQFVYKYRFGFTKAASLGATGR